MSAAGGDALARLIEYGPGAGPAPGTPGLAVVEALRPPPPRAWRATARPEQLAVADSATPYVLLLAGRGAGKTFAAANALTEWALRERGYYAVVAPTFRDCRSLCVEGPSGLLRALGSDLLSYDRSKYELHLNNGSVIVMASDEAPGRLRGPNFTGAWCDEIGSWKRVKESWEEGVEFSTRIGSARKILTGTPKRGHRLVKEFHDRGVSGDPDVTLIRGRTMDNAANLSDEFLRIIRAKYEGTTLGRQELDGLLLADAEGAVVTTDLIDVTRVQPEHLPELRRVVVALDPAVTSRATSDHTGIVVVGLGGPPLPGYLGRVAMVGGDHAYLLADESVRATPRDWAARALKVAEQWAADAIVAEVNNGGDLVTTMITLVADADGIPIPRLISVRAAVDKRTRAEPVAGMWEQHRVHVVGALPDVEDQFAGWTPGDRDSPDQFDAAVWGVVSLFPELGIGSATRVKVLNSGLYVVSGR